jgi:hypothetical protein
VAYVVAGLVIGGVWMLHAGESPLVHAIRLLVLMAVVMSLSTAARRVAAKRGRVVAHPPLGRFLVLKLALLALAVVAATMLDAWVPHADVWIAVGLALLVMTVGPHVHPWLVGRTATEVPA